MKKKVTTAFMCDGKTYQLVEVLFHINIYKNMDEEGVDTVLITDKANNVVAEIEGNLFLKLPEEDKQ